LKGFIICSWQQAAIKYLDGGQAFIQECVEVGAMSKQRLMVVDRLRADLENADSQYNAALDELEVKPTDKVLTEAPSSKPTVQLFNALQKFGNIPTCDLHVHL
jgi:non-ribosomal peptide synthetase component E (peptide arylation enzyme)